MGRIKPKKHRGIADPIQQNKARLFKIKDKINDPPKENDQAKISNKVRRFLELKEYANKGIPSRKFVHGIQDYPKKFDKKNKLRPRKEFPNFKKHKHETDEAFMRRVNRTTREGIQEAQYEAKYGVDVERNTNTGNIKITKRKEVIMDKKKKQLTQKQKDFIKEEVKKNIRDHKKSKIEPEEFKTDYVKFGEIVHAPPTIKIIPRKATRTESTARPGQKNLLLRTVIDPNDIMKPIEKKIPIINFNATKIIANSKIDTTGKRKKLPIGTRVKLEQEQQQFVEMYRLMKKNKAKAFPTKK